MAFITDDFLLHGETARRLYHTFAADRPIYDYHCHLSPEDIADDRRFRNLFEIWLEGDHYKWRAMRANGVPERYCTGDAPPYDKFMAWAKTIPKTLRNPLYHWTHLELTRYFGITERLDETTGPNIWARANDRLADPALSARGVLRRFDVRYLCTTDDPADGLESHEAIAAAGLGTRVYPCYRPDRALRTQDPAGFNAWVDRLASRADIAIGRLAEFLDALRARHEAFHRHGCRLSDHGLDACFAQACNDEEAARLFARVRSGRALDRDQADSFGGYLMLFFGRLDAERGWTKQLHVGALRNVNSRMHATPGADSGFDSIGDWPQIRPLAWYLDALTRENALPQTILYSANPGDNYPFATMIGNFQDGSVPGKLQLGSAWWFLDQKEAIEWQLNALSTTGLLSRFVGMLTDSRSFMSYPRHEYFRRVLCNLLGQEMDRGELPNDDALIGGMVRDICFDNAVAYFRLP